MSPSTKPPTHFLARCGRAWCSGLIEDHRIAPVTEIGKLSHLRRDDLNPAQILQFAQTLPGSRIRRVFLAGGEPLIWPPIIRLIRVLKHGGLQVIVCTEGTPLNRPEITHSLVELGVDAVSVSLDSVDPVYNDRLRPSRNGRDGWRQVVDGIQALVTARGDHDRPQVGIYSVITNQNLADIEAVDLLTTLVGDLPGLEPIPVALGENPNGYAALWRIERPRPRELCQRLAAAGVVNAIGTFGLRAAHTHPACQTLHPAVCPRAEALIDSLLSVPVTSADDDERIGRIAKLIRTEVAAWH